MAHNPDIYRAHLKARDLSDALFAAEVLEGYARASHVRSALKEFGALAALISTVATAPAAEDEAT